MEARINVRDFKECVITSGAIGHEGEGIGWYQIHDELWCYMDNAPNRSNHVWGFVTRGLVYSWIARVGNHICKTDEGIDAAMKFVEGRVAHDMAGI